MQDYIIDNHGDILANLPGVLGYYPTHSLVLVFIERDEATGESVVGPIMRTDLDDVLGTDDTDGADNTDSEIASMVCPSWARAAKYESMLGFVIGDGNIANIDLDINDPAAIKARSREVAVFSRTVKRIAHAIEASATFPTLHSMVYAPWIAQGAPYHVVYQHPLAYNADEGGAGAFGFISDIATSATLKDFVATTGDLPAISRDDIIARLASTEHSIDDADHYDMAMLSMMTVDNTTDVEALRRDYERAASGINQAHPSTEALAAGMRCYMTPRLRDPLLAALIEDPARGLVFAEAIMRAIPRNQTKPRADATATVALLAQANGHDAFAAVAGQHATDVDPTSNYARLVNEMLTIGRHEELIALALDGAREMRADLFAEQ